MLIEKINDDINSLNKDSTKVYSDTFLQNEAIRQFVNAFSSPRMNENDADILADRVLKAYHINESTLDNYLDTYEKKGHFLERDVITYENCRQLVENLATVQSSLMNGGIGVAAGAAGTAIGNMLGGGGAAGKLLGGIAGTAAGSVGAYFNAKRLFKQKWADTNKITPAPDGKGYIYFDPDTKKNYLVQVDDKYKVTSLTEYKPDSQSKEINTDAAVDTDKKNPYDLGKDTATISASTSATTGNK